MQKIIILFSIILLILPLAGCGQPATLPEALPAGSTAGANLATEHADDAQEEALADAQATQDAQAALDLQARLKATDEAAALAESQPAEPATAQPTPTPIRLPELSEEEMVSEINRNVDKAAAAAQSAAVSYQSALTDAVLTVDEVRALKSYIDEAYAALDLAYALTYKFYDTYSALAEESLGQLQRMESELNALDARLDEIHAALLEVEGNLAESLEVTQEMLGRLDGALQSVSGQAQTAIGQAQALADTHQAELASRVEAILALAPETVPASQEEAIRSLHAFWEAAQAALADEAISAEELDLIAQKRAEAVAGLEQYGGPLLEVFVAVLDELTAKLATGELQEVISQLEALGGTLPAIP